MDPDEALRRLRELALLGEQYEEDETGLNVPSKAEAFLDMAGLFRGLDGWLVSGGFLPKDWRKPVEKPKPPKPVEVDADGTIARVAEHTAYQFLKDLDGKSGQTILRQIGRAMHVVYQGAGVKITTVRLGKEAWDAVVSHCEATCALRRPLDGDYLVWREIRLEKSC